MAVGDLYVIRYTTMPALLLENGFMDSTHDTPVILTAAHAGKTAQGIVDFLAKELGLSKKDSAQDIPVPDKPQENGPYITVNKGDTLSGIGKRLGVAWKDIADLNGLTSPYTLHIGQKLRIPSKASAQPYYPAYAGKKTTLAVALTSLGISSSYSPGQTASPDISAPQRRIPGCIIFWWPGCLREYSCDVATAVKSGLGLKAWAAFTANPVVICRIM